MAGIKIPRTLKNFNCAVDGEGYAGRVTEVQLPTIGVKTEDHMAGGMEFNRKMDMGLEDLEITFTSAELSNVLKNKVAIFNDSNTEIRIWGAIHDEVSTAAQNVTAIGRGTITKVEPSAFGAGKKTEDKYTMSLKYYEEIVDGVTVYKIDNDNYIRQIDGVDQVESIRAAIRL